MPEWTLPGRPESVPLARRLATEALPELAPDSAQIVALLVSELVTNCVRHARTDFRLAVLRAHHDIRVEITDNNQAEPVIRQPAPTEPHGRGLQIVTALAQHWGVTPASRESGKTVWFTIAAQPDQPRIGTPSSPGVFDVGPKPAAPRGRGS